MSILKSRPLPRGWRAGLTRVVGFGLLVALDGHVELGNQALVLVATAAVATLWMPGWPGRLAVRADGATLARR